MIIYILLIILFIILIYNIDYFTNDNLKLLSNTELQDILISNKDKYYDRFSNLDLKVRNVNSCEEYIMKIKDIYYKCNNDDYYKILNAVNNVDNVLKKYNIVGFDGNKASNIKWKIGIINNNIYEYGLPHTRYDVIIISYNIINSNRLKSILLHEKIHVYQKLFSTDIQQYLNANGFSISRKKTDIIRANPDIDEYIYKNNNNQELMCIYNDNPQSILDVIYLPNNNINNEHPFEYMAYMIESELSNNFL